MNPIKVLCVCGPVKSGVPVYVEQVVRRLEGSEFHFVVACPQGSILRKRLANTGIDIVDADMRQLSILSSAKASFQLWRILKRGRFDIVHMHSSRAGLLGRPVCKLLGLRTVYTPHGFSFESIQSSKAKFRCYLLAEQILGRATDWMACVSEHEREKALRYRIVRAERACVIHGFADSNRWTQRPASISLKRELGIPLNSRVVGTVSRLCPDKAPKDFAAMAAALLRNCPEVRFVFVGEDGPLHAEVVGYIRQLGIQDRVILRTWTDNICEFVALMDVVVLNSLTEGLPLSLIEAMAMGKPIIATDLAATRELTANGGCGLLVPASDPEAMANAVQRLLESPEILATLGESGRRRMHSQYSVEQAVQKTAELYRELAADRFT
jgi:glycosyltransferase involved in cell wall biosynthesis